MKRIAMVVAAAAAALAAWFWWPRRPATVHETAVAPAPSAAPRTTPETPARPGGPRPIADRVAQTMTPTDLRLLAAVERITGRSPSDDVLELVRRAGAGADEASLRAFIGERFPTLALRNAAMDWLDARAGRKPAPPLLGASPGGPTVARPVVDTTPDAR